MLRPEDEEEVGGAKLVLVDTEVVKGDVGAIKGMDGGGLSEEERGKVLRFEFSAMDEDAPNSSIGFFLAKFRRVA